MEARNAIMRLRDLARQAETTPVWGLRDVIGPAVKEAITALDDINKRLEVIEHDRPGKS